MVCSCAWTLVNRGSKYWQESWEKKVERFEVLSTGTMFAVEEVQQPKGFWLSGRKYSVSKLAIALSDYVFLLWLSIVIGEAVLPRVPACVQLWLRQAGAISFIIFSGSYVILLLVFGRKTRRPL